MHKHCVYSAVLLLVWANTLASAADVAVATCGQSYSGNGYLTGDLDCAGSWTPAVTVLAGRLDLRGFTLTGGTDVAVRCETNCVVESEPVGGMVAAGLGGRAAIESGCGGLKGVSAVTVADATVTGGADYAIGRSYTELCPVFVRALRLTLVDSEVLDSGGSGVRATRANVRRSRVAGHAGDGIDAGYVSAMDTMVIDNGGWGIAGAYIKARLRGSTVSGNAVGGVNASRANIRESTIEANGGYGVRSAHEPVTVLDSIVSGNDGTGIAACGVRVMRSLVTNNAGHGVVAEICTTTPAVKVSDSTVSGNGHHGVGGVGNACHRDVTLRGTVAAGNGVHPDCGVTEVCADVVGCWQPHVSSGSTCEHSYLEGSGFPGTTFGICSLD